MKISDLMNGKRPAQPAVAVKQRVSDMRAVKKMSAFEATQQEAYAIIGNRVQTYYGFDVEVYKNPDVRVYYSHMMQGARTHEYEATRGYRVYQCLHGAGVAGVTNGDQISEIGIVSGSSFVVEAGSAFYVSTAPNSDLRFFVTEASDFEPGLIVTLKASYVEVPEDMLRAVRPGTVVPVREFSKNDKSVLNLIAERAQRAARAEQVTVSSEDDYAAMQRMMDEKQGIDTTDA